MFTKRIGIDLGTANSLVWLAGAGVVLNEPTVVAVTVDDNRVVAVGNEAKEMLGRTPGNITATRPMRDGVIADYRITEVMLSYFIDRVVGRNRFFKPEVMICVPSGVTQVERRAVLDATLSAGARAAYLIEEPLAAAIGAKIPIAQASGHMIVDVGGGSTEAAIISLGGVVVHKSARVAGNKIDEAIALYVKKKYNLIIGERMAELIKVTIGDAVGGDATRGRAEERGKELNTMEVRGRDAISGLPRMVELTRPEVTEAILPVLQQIILAVKGVLEETPPELAADIIDKGIVMAGGTSMLRNFDQLMTQTTGVVCHVAEESLLCVVRGTGVALENIELYKRSISRK
ncbi:rod shape-determining protein [Patescibacteria group bacterium]|nr:rod shape-determining protein [Patescibacteria group bacterium]